MHLINLLVSFDFRHNCLHFLINVERKMVDKKGKPKTLNKLNTTIEGKWKTLININ